MQTVCDLKIELKKRNIKGISGLNKSQLVALLASGKSQPKKEGPKPAKKETPPPTPKLLTMKTEQIPMMNMKISVLRRLQTSLNKLIKDTGVFKAEKDIAIQKLKLVKAAIAAKTKKK